MSDDEKLTTNFSLYDLTQTTHIQLQQQNRHLQNDQIQKLKMVALLLEGLGEILETKLIIHSGYRCPELNKLVGSSINSQHLKCEAVDFVCDSLDTIDAFAMLRVAAKAGKFAFGQMILEKQDRSYGVQIWIHISLGAPYRDKLRCGQVLTMNDGQYELLETITA